MSRTPFFYVEKYNIENNSWEKQTLYTINRHGETEEIDFWPWNATYDVFPSYFSNQCFSRRD